MKKNIIKTTVLGISLLMLCATANAATYEVNLYGASAQYTYWLKASPEFLKSLGCSVSNIFAAQSTDGKQGITICVGDTAFGGKSAQTSGGATVNGITNQTVVMRYASKASYDGVNAVQGLNPATPPECSNLGQRLMANESAATWQLFDDATPGWVPTKGSLTGTACKPVIIGASDVNAATFNQKSAGQLRGHLGGGYITRDISGYSISSASYNNSKPLVVPFAFFANTNAPVSNISRLMATQIFSSAVSDWNQLDTTLPSQGIVVCMRHAGSGTLSTLDAAVMRGDAVLVQTENNPNDPVNYDDTLPIAWFNDGSTDEANCLNQNGGQVATYGAIGYMDADFTLTSYPNIKLLNYMGVAPTKNNIMNGTYDFWSAQNLYWSKSLSASMTSLLNSLVSFASNPANLTVAKFGTTADYWCTANQMKVKKDTDRQYPYRF